MLERLGILGYEEESRECHKKTQIRMHIGRSICEARTHDRQRIPKDEAERPLETRTEGFFLAKELDIDLL